MDTPVVRVRMYNVGFGDCFLLRFPAIPRDRLVLIDCGVHSASRTGHELSRVVGDIIETARSVTGEARIDVVVATHRHRDHVHGFRDRRWIDVTVGEVWLPWTEDPADPEARRILDGQSKRAALLLQLAADSDDDRWRAIRAIAENNDQYKNARAMAMLHDGFAGRPRRSFLPRPPGEPRARAFRSRQLPGVDIEIVGPLRSEAVIRDLKSPPAEVYVRLDGSKDVLAPVGRDLPFERWRMSKAEFRAAYGHVVASDNDLQVIINSGKEAALGLAVALEDAVNGTSLMLRFAYRGLSLLFAGDAEWGTWDAALGDRALAQRLANVDLYKVSHHGSTNGTPQRYVELERQAGLALVSVGATTIKSWQQIPRKRLLDALDAHDLQVIRSDRRADTLAAAARRRAAGVTADVTVADDALWTEVALTPPDGDD